MASTLEIVQGIKQAMANAYDGAHDERLVDGEDLVKKIGLRREEGCPLTDTRNMDAVFVKIHGNILYVYYHTEVLSKESHNNQLKSEIEQRIADTVSYLKKEYRKVNGESLSLGSGMDLDIDMQFISRRRVSVRACQGFQIKGMGEDVEDLTQPASDPDRLEKSIKDFLALGREKAKKPSNYTAKNEQ
tara:strand:+ start:3597 stop:4160 length:564 start_codon:yes stop_codon:yes gene_type:complete